MNDAGRSDTTVIGPSVAPVLQVVQGNEKGRSVRVRIQTRVGREHDNDLVLTDPRVSRHHSLIELIGSHWLIRDLGSANGTFVNNQAVTAARALRPDDLIRIGDTLLVFQPTKPVTIAEARSRSPRGAHPGGDSGPQWGWLWIAGGLVLIAVLIGLAIVFNVLGGPDGMVDSTPVAPTEAINLEEGDFVLVYKDDFSDPSSGWDDAFDRYTIKQYGNNKYYIEITTSNLVAWGLANRDVANFRMQVEATQESGPNNNGYGLLFRFRDRDNYYRFDISGEGFFLLSKFNDGEWSTIVPWTASSALNVGQSTNTLTVEAIGDRIRLFVNGVQVAEAQDDSISHGNFGFFANTFSDPNLIVSFDNIELWTPRGEALAIIPTATPTRHRPPPTPETPATGGSPEPTPSHTPAVDTIERESPVVETSTPETLLTEEATSLPTASPSVTTSPTLTPTPVPLPDYVSRDLPLARNAEELEGRFYFPVFDTEEATYNIYSTDANGNNRRLVVAEASQPTLNSDGMRIGYRSWKPDNRGLVERGVTGGDEWRFNAFFESARPTFAPDGQSFLFFSREGGEIPAIYHTSGANYEVLRREGGPIQGNSPAWVSDDSFVYQGCLGGNCGLILSGLDGSFPRQLTQDPGDTNPHVSPDGKVAFMSERSGNWDVYVVDVENGGLTQLTTDSANDGLPHWLPDGETIIFVSDRDGVWEMWAMDADGGNRRALFELGGPLDGRVAVDVQNSRGWLEESIAWSP